MLRGFIKVAFVAGLLALLQSCAVGSHGYNRTSEELRPELGLRLRVISTDEWPASIVNERPNLLEVVSVKAYQSAYVAGVQRGDILLELNNVSVSGMADSVGIVHRHAWGETVLATVLRDQVVHRIPVVLKKDAGTSPTVVAGDDSPLTTTEARESLSMISSSGNSTTVVSQNVEKLAENSVQADTRILELEAKSGDRLQTDPQFILPVEMSVDDTSAPGDYSGDYSGDYLAINDLVVVYGSPSFSTSVVTTLSKGSVVSAIGRVDEWLQVDTMDGLGGYVHLTELQQSDNKSIRKVSVQYTNMRSGPGTAFGIVDSLDKHDLVNVVSDEGKWLLVHQVSNPKVVGYVHKSLLEIRPLLH